jgi:hypothetical protein
MNTLELSKVTEYVNTNIDDFHAAKAKSLAEMKLKGILKLAFRTLHQGCCLLGAAQRSFGLPKPLSGSSRRGNGSGSHRIGPEP